MYPVHPAVPTEAVPTYCTEASRCFSQSFPKFLSVLRSFDRNLSPRGLRFQAKLGGLRQDEVYFSHYLSISRVEPEARRIPWCRSFAALCMLESQWQ